MTVYENDGVLLQTGAEVKVNINISTAAGVARTVDQEHIKTKLDKLLVKRVKQERTVLRVNQVATML